MLSSIFFVGVFAQNKENCLATFSNSTSLRGFVIKASAPNAIERCTSRSAEEVVNITIET